MTKNFTLFLGLILSSFLACVDSIEPEFDFRDNLIFIDAYVLTEPGISSVNIRRSQFIGGEYKIETVANARVKVKAVNSNLEVLFEQDSAGVYICPLDFAAEPGSTWQLFVDLEDGRSYESLPEQVTENISFDNLKATFDEQVRYEVNFNRFVPGHRILVDWQDPPNVDNYYLWKYRTFEPLTVCKTCPEGIFRNGNCNSVNSSNPPWRPKYTNYTCETSCWQIRYADELPIFSDQFSDGAFIADREVATIPYYRDRDILLELQQITISPKAFEYFKTINDLVNASSGLNAPPPAALYGNMLNPSDPEDIILGQFVAASVYSERLFIDRSNLLVGPIQDDRTLRLEDCFNCPTTFPCINSYNRTNEEPEGWPE